MNGIFVVGSRGWQKKRTSEKETAPAKLRVDKGSREIEPGRPSATPDSNEDNNDVSPPHM
jgi:hypothetical protein